MSGFHGIYYVYAEALSIYASRLPLAEGCLMEAVGDDNDTDPGFDEIILPAYGRGESLTNWYDSLVCVRSA